MILLAIDENFNNDIVRGLLRRQLSIDLLRVQDAGLSGANALVILEWAARQGRVLISHDGGHHHQARVRSRGCRAIHARCV